MYENLEAQLMGYHQRKYIPIKPKIDTNPELAMRSILLMWKVQKKKRPIQGVKLVVTYITVKYIYIIFSLAWLLAPFIE